VAGIIGMPGRLQSVQAAAFARNPRPTSSEYATLSEQHQAGRTVTRKILDTAGQVRGEAAGKQNCISAMQAFVTMYRPHAAREDTVLFPKLREIVSGHEFDTIGEEMEKREHQHFGEDGFEKAVAQITEIEKKIGLYDLAQFTPTT
jgi:hemerythrin-like domain-containing protein